MAEFIETARSKDSTNKNDSIKDSPKNNDSIKETESNIKMRLKKLDNEMLLCPKLLYSSMSMLYYGFYTFRPIFLSERLGFSDKQYGDVSAVMATATIPALTLWGYLTDRTRRHNVILTGITLAVTFFFEIFALNDRIKISGSFIILSIFSFFVCGLQPLTDHQVLLILGGSNSNDKNLYGRQRLFDSIFYGLTTVALGWLIKKYTLSVLFWWIPASAILFICLLWICYILHCEDIDSSNCSSVDVESVNICTNDQLRTKNGDATNITTSGIISLMLNPEFAFFLLLVFIIGIGRSTMALFVAKYMHENLTLSTFQIGLASGFGIVIEVLVLFSGSYFINTIGAYWMLFMSLLTMAARMWMYGFFLKIQWIQDFGRNALIVYLIELLKGLSFGLTQVAGVKLSSEIASENLQATAQTLYYGTYCQLPSILSACLGGRIYEKWGGEILFFTVATLSTSGATVYLIKFLLRSAK